VEVIQYIKGNNERAWWGRFNSIVMTHQNLAVIRRGLAVMSGMWRWRCINLTPKQM